MLTLTLAFFGLALAFSGNASASGLEEVSLLQLIATPEKYDGKQVRAIGYMHLEFEGNGLYLHQEDCLQALYKNGVWLENAQTAQGQALNDGYVLIEGVFSAQEHGHLGLWSGTIKNITRMMAWGQRTQKPSKPSGHPAP